MNLFKLVMSVMICCIFIQTTTAQKNSSNTSSISQLIANGADEAVILKSWENLVLQKQIATYPAAEKLLNQTMQKAYLQGNKYLGASITKTAYYSQLTVTLGKEIGHVKAMLQQGSSVNFNQKNFKLQPDARDMQRLAGVKKIDLESQRQLRYNLVNQAQAILAYVPGFRAAKGQKVSGKNKRKATLPNVFATSDVVLSNGKTITTKEELNLYHNRLVDAYKTADMKLKTSGTQLQGITMMQQQVAQNEAVLKAKLLKKAATIIN